MIKLEEIYSNDSSAAIERLKFKFNYDISTVYEV